MRITTHASWAVCAMTLALAAAGGAAGAGEAAATPMPC